MFLKFNLNFLHCNATESQKFVLNLQIRHSWEWIIRNALEIITTPNTWLTYNSINELITSNTSFLTICWSGDSLFCKLRYLWVTGGKHSKRKESRSKNSVAKQLRRIMAPTKHLWCDVFRKELTAFHFYTPWKYQKIGGFLMFSRGTEVECWLKMD